MTDKNHAETLAWMRAQLAEMIDHAEQAGDELLAIHLELAVDHIERRQVFGERR